MYVYTQSYIVFINSFQKFCKNCKNVRFYRASSDFFCKNLVKKLETKRGIYEKHNQCSLVRKNRHNSWTYN